MVVVSCFEFVLCHTNVSICVSGCYCYCGFVDYVTCKTRTIERAKVFVSAIAFSFAANPIAFGEDFLIVALDNVCLVGCAAVADFQIVSVEDLVEFA